MKDKIVYFSIGAIVVLFSVIILNLMNEKPQTPEMNLNPIFDSVTIKGTLVIGNEENFIMLEGDKEASNIIIDSKGSNIVISTNPKGSTITLSKHLGENANIGAMLTQQQRPQGNLVTHFMLKDSKGVNVIRSTD